MSLFKGLKKAASSMVPSPIQIDFEKGGVRRVQEVAPYPKEVFWDTTVPIYKTESGIEYVRTPEERFQNLPGYDFVPNYIEIDGLRMHYLDEGPKDGPILLLLHGQPVWSFLYRKMIKELVPKGYRCIAPDMMGMGKSDKPIKEAFHYFDRHCEMMLTFIQQLELTNITAFVQDWGSLIGTCLVGENPDLFARLVLANGDLPLLTEETNPFYIPNPVVVNPKISTVKDIAKYWFCLLYTSPSPRDATLSRMPSSA